MVLFSVATMMTVPKKKLAEFQIKCNQGLTLKDNSTAEVDISRNSQMIKLDDVGYTANSLLELRHLLEVTAKLDQRSRSKAVGIDDKLAVAESVEIGLDKHQIRASLDRQEASSWNIDTMRVLEMTDGSTNGSLELDDAEISLALLVSGNRLLIGNDLHLKLVGLNDTLDSSEVHPDIVGVEVLELLDGLEFVDVLLGNLSNFEKLSSTLIVDDGATLDISFGLVRELHDVFRLGLNHVLQDSEIDNGAQVVGIGEEDDFNATFDQLIKNAAVVERLEHVTMTGRVPVRELRLE